MATRDLYETSNGSVTEFDIAVSSVIDQIDDDETDSASFTVLADFEVNMNDELDFYDYTNTIIYSGVVRDITNDNPKELLVFKYDILLDDRIVNDVFENVTIEALIEDIVTTYSTLTYSSTFVSGITLDRYVSKNKTALSVLRDLIALVPNLTFNVDKDKVFTLFLKDSIDSGVVLTNATDSVVLNGWAQDTSKQVTRLTFIGEKQVQQDKIESFNGTGAQTDFVLSEIPASIKIEVGGVEQTLQVSGQNDGDYTVSPETKTVTFLAGSIPASGTNNVVVTYTFQIDITLEYDASFDIQSIYGIIEKKVTKKYINTIDDAFNFCTQYINKFGVPLLSAKIQRAGSYDISGLIPGYKVFVTDTINEVQGEDISGFYAIKSVKRTFPGGGVLIEVGDIGVDGFNILSETRYNVNQLYEQDNNSSIIQKSQIIDENINIEIDQEIELQLERTLPTNYMYWGNANDTPVYANIGDGTPRPLKSDSSYNEEMWLDFDGDALDSTGNGNNGTWTGTEQYGTGTVTAQAADFNGSSYVRKTSASIPNTSLKSVTMWINTASLPLSTTIPLVSYPFFFGAVWILNNKIVADISDGVRAIRINTNLDLTINNWYFIAVDYTNSKVYVNNVDVTDSTTVIGAGSSQSTITIGAETNYGVYYTGLVNDLRLFDTELTESEFILIYGSEFLLTNKDNWNDPDEEFALHGDYVSWNYIDGEALLTESGDTLTSEDDLELLIE